ncbi:AAA family ATPase [Helicobacter turcicus]|uniref:AAA family ATPase n=1 Tax=Helicobacter turcicus TaxID=2867412 RepID=A0ABS7JP79_9HELI|nr:AAA family ATPase [Helicobacter turcicus]MBX7491208.1 AAA family ATPase [Helicobacter turcicus]MBX7546153.1 AAA family ATPase [Helicobacter turcicus]
MIISIVNEKGGSGKSTLAINLATKFHCDGNDIILVDADPQRSIEHFLNFRDENLDLPFNSVSKLGETLAKEIKNLQEKYKIIIIDTGGRDSKEMRQALIVSDIVIVPIIPSGLDISVFEKMVGIIAEAKIINENLIPLIIISKASPNPFLEKKINDLKEYLNNKDIEDFVVSKNILFEREAFKNAIFEGKGIVEIENSKAKDDFLKFFVELDDIIKNKGIL